jgi:hypothetical protein
MCTGRRRPPRHSSTAGQSSTTVTILACAVHTCASLRTRSGHKSAYHGPMSALSPPAATAAAIATAMPRRRCVTADSLSRAAAVTTPWRRQRSGRDNPMAPPFDTRGTQRPESTPFHRGPPRCGPGGGERKRGQRRGRVASHGLTPRSWRTLESITRRYKGRKRVNQIRCINLRTMFTHHFCEQLFF